MKRIAASLLAVCVVSLLICGTAQAAAKLRIGTLNMPKIYKELPDVQKVTLYLKKRKADFQTDLDAGTKTLYGLMKEIKDTKNTLSQEERRQKEAQWRRMKFDLDLKFQKFKEELKTLEKREFETLKAKIDAAIQRVVRARRFDLVLEKQWVYHGNTDDITDEVLNLLLKSQ